MTAMQSDQIQLLQLARERYERAAAMNVYGLSVEDRAEADREYYAAQAQYERAQEICRRASQGKPLQYDPLEQGQGWTNFYWPQPPII